MRKKDPSIAKRNAEIVRLYRDEGLSMKTLAHTYGVSVDTIKAVLRPANVKAARGRGGVRRLDTLKPITPLHLQIGVRLDAHRVFVRHLSVSQFSAGMKMSIQRLRRGELGAYDFTLSELMRIAELLGVSLPQLVTFKDLVHEQPATKGTARKLREVASCVLQ
jgi:hypothetical protein